MKKIYETLTQGSEEWLEARRGLLTASEIKHIMTPTLKKADNDKSREHVFEILAQRVSQYVEPKYVNDDMLRGVEDEVTARILYDENFAPTRDVGFITNDKWGFVIGYSPDGLVGDTGAIEIKSRIQKHQIKTIIANEVPQEYILQIQTGLLVAELEWLDFVSYRDGLPLFVKRVYPDEAIQQAIVEAAYAFEESIQKNLAIYKENSRNLVKTERVIDQEITL